MESLSFQMRNYMHSTRPALIHTHTHTGQGLLLELPFRPAGWLMNAPWPLTLCKHESCNYYSFYKRNANTPGQSSSARQLNSITLNWPQIDFASAQGMKEKIAHFARAG
jgi:hypothetical protein